MTATLRALIISPHGAVLRHNQRTVCASPKAELSLHSDWLVSGQRNLLPHVVPMLHSETAAFWLSQLWMQGYGRPALKVAADTKYPAIVPLEDDLRPLENVSWAVLGVGGLQRSTEMSLNPTIYKSSTPFREGRYC